MLVAVKARTGAWIDTDFPLTRSVITAILAAKKVGVIRYLPLPSNSSAGDLSAIELANLCGVDLDVLAVQHVRRAEPGYNGWRPSKHDPKLDAQTAVAAAERAGYPYGAHIYLDVEDVSGTSNEMRDFANGWAETIVAEGYRAGAYDGYQNPIDADGMYLLHGIDTYFSDMANRRVSTRGCAMLQGGAVTIGGVLFDQDTLMPDKLGDLPFACRFVSSDIA